MTSGQETKWALFLRVLGPGPAINEAAFDTLQSRHTHSSCVCVCLCVCMLYLLVDADTTARRRVAQLHYTLCLKQTKHHWHIFKHQKLLMLGRIC